MKRYDIGCTENSVKRSYIETIYTKKWKRFERFDFFFPIQENEKRFQIKV